MINPNVQAKYLDNPDLCPFCNGDSLAGGSPEFSDSKTVVREVECYSPGCRKKWTEIFKLADIEENS